MKGKLLDLQAKILLEKFGAGEHKPGSGSAAAYQGMLSAQLIKTVISLTTDNKRKKRYKDIYSELKAFESDINERIYPQLESYFQKDSEIFDEAIQLRIKRDNTKDRKIKFKLAEDALNKLKPATEMPVKIASLCVDLANYGIYIFDNGFVAVRGDSGVALNSALSAVGGCLSIIDLNLTSFPKSKWTDKIRLETNKLRNNFKELTKQTNKRLAKIQREAELKNKYHEKIDSFNSIEIEESSIKNADIEELAKELQNTLWQHKEFIWPKNTPADPIEIIKPERILKILGYNFNRVTTLGQHPISGNLVEIAGLINKEDKYVAISEQFSPEIQNFTIAHEIGHAILHKQKVLHRDRAIDGSNLKSRDIKELQADKFATFLLMPEKQVRRAFKDLFKMDRFVIDDDTAFLMNLSSQQDFKIKFKNLRGMSRYLASTESFGLRKFDSLAKLFQVSVETMAIRLEELNLVEFTDI